jgi:hypothetical protein
MLTIPLLGFGTIENPDVFNPSIPDKSAVKHSDVSLLNK